MISLTRSHDPSRTARGLRAGFLGLVFFGLVQAWLSDLSYFVKAFYASSSELYLFCQAPQAGTKTVLTVGGMRRILYLHKIIYSVISGVCMRLAWILLV